MPAHLLEMKGIRKEFSGVPVLRGVDFTLYPGEIHALMGENGAGKSTLMKILAGVHRKDGGVIRIDGEEREIPSAREAMGLGVAVIHQELNLISHLTVMENLFLGREMVFGRTGWIRWRQMKEEARKWLEPLGLEVDPSREVASLSVGEQQLVEIARALSMQARILVLDEPTSALTNREIDTLFQILRSLKEKGVGMIYISHRMEEIFEICDRITVLRDGEWIGTRRADEIDVDELIRMMVGRDIKNHHFREPVEPGEERLRVEGLTRKGQVEDVSFSIRRGEIVGLTGLMGAGRTEAARLLFGVDAPDRGKVWVDGKEVRVRHPADAIREGIAFVTENRKEEGLVLSLSVRENLSLPNLDALSARGVIRGEKEKRLVEESIRRLSIKTAGPGQEVRFLSGGNQQKVVIGKWLATSPRVLILDEPTRGVDIGAKEEIYRLMNRLTREGMAILLISSDLPEVLGMSDRVLVMHRGRIAAEFKREEATQEKILAAASGGCAS